MGIGPATARRMMEQIAEVLDRLDQEGEQLRERGHRDRADRLQIAVLVIRHELLRSVPEAAAMCRHIEGHLEQLLKPERPPG